MSPWLVNCSKILFCIVLPHWFSNWSRAKENLLARIFMYFVDISKLGLSLSKKRDQSVYKLHDGNNRNAEPRNPSTHQGFSQVMLISSKTHPRPDAVGFGVPITAILSSTTKRVLILYRMSFTCSFCNPDTCFTFFHHLRVIVVQDSRKSWWIFLK